MTSTSSLPWPPLPHPPLVMTIRSSYWLQRRSGGDRGGEDVAVVGGGNHDIDSADEEENEAHEFSPEESNGGLVRFDGCSDIGSADDTADGYLFMK